MMILFSIYLDHLPGALYTRKVVWTSKRDHELRAEQRGEQRRPTNSSSVGSQLFNECILKLDSTIYLEVAVFCATTIDEGVVQYGLCNCGSVAGESVSHL